MNQDSDSSYLDSEAEINHRLTEQGTDRWSRLPTNGIPGEDDFFKGDGTPNTRYLALGDEAKIPVFDELTAWMKRNNKVPADEIFQARGGHHPEDTIPNFEAAERRFGLDIPLPGVPADEADRKFYDRWSETLDFRWNYDFADLRLRRAKRHGWKWRLIRLRPNGTVVVSPFVKPAQTPFRERGLKSGEASVARISSASLLDRMKKQAQARWKGMPITDKEEREDEARIRNLRFIEGLKNNYGFMGEMLCGMGNDTGSGVAILAIGAVFIYLILFIYGPLEMVPYLAEFVTTVLPLQGTMKGVVTCAGDALRKPGEDYIEGNVRQWLLYWPFARTLSFFQGWIYLVRPNWYRAICGWRTLLCALCASPFFNDRSLHPSDLKETRKRLMKVVWKERGERMAQEHVLFEIAERKATGNKASKISQGRNHNGGTRFDAVQYAMKILDEARMLHGFMEESWQGGHFPDARGRPSASSLRGKITEFTEFLNETGLGKQIHDIEGLSRENKVKFEEMTSNLQKAVGRGYIHTRTTGGSEAFKDHLKRIYGATDENLAEFMHTLSVERGVIGSRTDGMEKARSSDALRGQHGDIQRRAVKGPAGNLVVEAEKPFYEQGYSYNHNQELADDVKKLDDLYLSAAGGNMQARKYLEGDQNRIKQWGQKLTNLGYGGGSAARSRLGIAPKSSVSDPEGWAPNNAFSEDLTGELEAERRHPGTGILQRPGAGGYTDRSFMFKHKSDEEEAAAKQAQMAQMGRR